MKKLFLLLIAATCLRLTVFGQFTDDTNKQFFTLTDTVIHTSVKDQALSPTCWVFGTNSLFESDIARLYNLRFNLSEMFIARYAYIDKALRYLETGGTTYFEGGGQFHDVIRVVRKYGIVPEDVYPGLPDDNISHNHEKLDTAMQQLVRGFLHKGTRQPDNTQIKQMEDTLDKYLGVVPESFRYAESNYTPLSFAAAWFPYANDYAELVSFADHPLYQQFILKDKYNWADDSFYNISLDDMKMVVDSALHNGWSVGWEGDVTEPGFNNYQGIAATDYVTRHYDEERLENYKSEQTERDHMLHITGIARDETGKTWYYMKNSWGTWLNPYQGFIYMNENYFRLKTVILFVNKRGLPEVLRNKLGLD